MILIYPYQSHHLGPAIQARKFIDYIATKRNCVILSTESKYWSDSNLITENNKVLTYFLSLLLRAPFASVKFINLNNYLLFRKVSNYAKDGILSFDFASTSLPLSYVSNNVIMIMPDCQYIRYINQNSYLDYLRYRLYLRLEKRVNSAINKAFFVSKTDVAASTLKESYLLPLIVDSENLSAISTNREGCLLLGSISDGWSLEGITKLAGEKRIVTLGKVAGDTLLVSMKVSYVENYWKFVNSFRVVVILDPPQSTGVSNRVLGVLVRGIRLICNGIALRGIDIVDNCITELSSDLYVVDLSDEERVRLIEKHSEPNVLSTLLSFMS